MTDFDKEAAPGYPIFLGSEFEQPDEANAYFHILPIPFEASTTYGEGTASGPSSILGASWQLETWDGKSIPGKRGIYTHPPIDCDGDTETVLARISEGIKYIVDNDGFPVGLGGEHTVTYGIISGLIEAGIEDFGIVQIDAHADMRDSYKGNPHSHATVMRRIADLDIPIYQLGVRALCEEEVQARKIYNIEYLDAEVLVRKNIHKFDLPDDFPDKIFFTIDIDGFDPSVFPSTGTPVPGGLNWYQVLNLFESVAQQAQIIGFDVMGFAPVRGFHAYEFSAALLVYKMMGIIERNQL